MMTDCNASKISLEGAGRRRVDVDFSGGEISSDGGVLLLKELDDRMRVTEHLANCFTDHRDEKLIEHSIEELLRQRVYGIVEGYEDLNDHDELSRDKLLAAAVGKSDPEGKKRRCAKDVGNPLASASTLGRIERTKADATKHSRYEKIVCDFDAMQTAFVDIFADSQKSEPTELVLDFDPSDIQLHGTQEERFYHGYYKNYCYLPMYLYCGQYPLAAKLRPSNIDGAQGTVEMLAPVVAQLRARWPAVRLIVRADSGFCRDELFTWCEENGVDYIIGVARNKRLQAMIGQQMKKARRKYFRTGKAARVFRCFRYQTLKSWSTKRRVVGKAEYLAKGENPRFVVSTLPASEVEARELYEDIYCARGEMENRIKEQQLDLFGDRASSHTFRGNELRIWFSLAAHLLVVLLRNFALQGTKLARAQASTLRVRLLKIGALVKVSVRRIYIQMSSAYPHKEVFMLAMSRLQALPVRSYP